MIEMERVWPASSTRGSRNPRLPLPALSPGPVNEAADMQNIHEFINEVKRLAMSAIKETHSTICAEASAMVAAA